jgi:hypothetical protein
MTSGAVVTEGPEAMSIFRYKGFSILARPYQLQESRHWTVDLEIRRYGRRQPFSAAARYGSEQEALAQCSGLGRMIIDGRVPGWSVEHMGGGGRRGPALVTALKGGFMRPLIIAGIVLLGLGAFVLIRGGSFTTKRNVLQVGDLKVSASERQSIPPWVGGAAVLAGVVMLVAGARKRA